MMPKFVFRLSQMSPHYCLYNIHNKMSKKSTSSSTLKKTWDFQKLFVNLGNGKSKKFVPIQKLVDELSNNLVLCLPVINALSGCYSTSKVGPKLSGMKASMDLSLLEGFGVEELSPQMIDNAERFLESGLKKTNCSTFDDYRWEQYYNYNKLFYI